ncbi:MAG: recombinase family protein [Clostridiales bacterium]|nr:recombinase family protein [Clostridiales bacterium]
MARKKRLDTDRILNGSTSVPVKEKDENIYHTAAYIRLSMEDSGKVNGYSLENQEKLVCDYIKHCQDMELYKLYVDNGFSGTKFERPAFDEMMQDMKSGKINCIVVKDLSRLGRNYLEAGNYLEQIFPFFRVRFISINDGYDSNSPNMADEALIIPLKNIINEGYARDISVKVTTAVEAKKKQGKYLGKYPPFGYLKDPGDKNHLLVDEEASAVVKRIFTLRDSGMPLGAIAKLLNNEGVPSPMRYFYLKGISKEEKALRSYWDRTKIKRMLQNPVYLGTLVYGKTQTSFAKGIPRHDLPEEEWKKVYNAHPAIINQKLFDSVQEKPEESKAVYYQNAGINDDYQPVNLFRGLIHCADCGAAMKMPKVVRRTESKARKQYAFYECCRRNAIRNYSCPRKTVMKDDLDKTVEEAIRFHIQSFLDAEAVIQNLNHTVAAETKGNEIKVRIREKQRRLAKIRRLGTGIYEDYREGILSETEYLDLRCKYANESEALQREVDELFLKEEDYSEEYQAKGTLAEIVKANQNFAVLNREIVETFIADVKVHTDDHLEIVFNFEDEFQHLIKMSEARKGEVQ